jgi:hypothetical protein
MMLQDLVEFPCKAEASFEVLIQIFSKITR